MRRRISFRVVKIVIAGPAVLNCVQPAGEREKEFGDLGLPHALQLACTWMYLLILAFHNMGKSLVSFREVSLEPHKRDQLIIDPVSLAGVRLCDDLYTVGLSRSGDDHLGHPLHGLDDAR